MSPFLPALRERTGYWLVTLQFGLLLWLAVLASPRMLRGELSWISLSLLGLSAALGGWTLLHNRLGNFNIRPAPRAGGVLVTAGPYRLIRHPMYTSVLLVAAVFASESNPLTAWLVWGALVLVLYVKSSLEERWLSEQHPLYKAYCLSCKRFVPWVF